MEQNCTILVHHDKGVPPTSSELQKRMENPDPKEKIAAAKTAILLLLNGERLPKLMMHVIRFCINTKDKPLKKLLMLYWEIATKVDANGKLKPEMILVCQALRNDLDHPNEFVRGCTLRFLTRIREPEILETLVPLIRSNLEHRTPFVRRNAVLCMYSTYQAFPDLMPDAPEEVAKFLEQEADISARRNAFMMLFNCDVERAVEFLVNNEEDCMSFGDGFQLIMLELVRKICKQDPSKKTAFIMVVFNLLKSDSASVAYEAAWTLVSLSGAPAAVRSAASTYCKLLTSSSSDNNVKLIVLGRLDALRATHGKVLQELTMDVLRALSTPNSDIREKTLEIAMALVSSKNIDKVIQVLRKELTRTQDDEEDKDGSYRQLLIASIRRCAERFPQTAMLVVPVLLEFLGGKGAQEVVLFVREVTRAHPELQQTVLERLCIALPSIKSAAVFRVVLWIMGEYASTEALQIECFDALCEALGPMPIVPPGSEPQGDTDDGAEEKQPQQVQQSRVTILADGTYATQTEFSEAGAGAGRDGTGGGGGGGSGGDDEALLAATPLRRLIIGGNFFCASVACATFVKLISRRAAAQAQGWADPSCKEMQVKAMLYMCSMVRLGQLLMTKNKRIDQDSLERISMWLRALVDPVASASLRRSLLLKDCSDSFGRMLRDRREREGTTEGGDAEEGGAGGAGEVTSQPDALITFRQLRGQRLLAMGAKEVDLDDEGDMVRATGVGGEGTPQSSFRERLRHVHQLTGFDDPVYAEAAISLNDYDISLKILVINRTAQTLTNLSVEMATMGGPQDC